MPPSMSRLFEAARRQRRGEFVMRPRLLLRRVGRGDRGAVMQRGLSVLACALGILGALDLLLDGVGRRRDELRAATRGEHDEQPLHSGFVIAMPTAPRRACGASSIAASISSSLTSAVGCG